MPRRIGGVLLVVGVGGLLGGCASYAWSRAGLTQQEFRTDKYQCERDVRQSGYYGGGVAGAIAMRNFFDACMEARGYEKVRVE